jgi:hypothetical protein
MITAGSSSASGSALVIWSSVSHALRDLRAVRIGQSLDTAERISIQHHNMWIAPVELQGI